MKRYFSAGIAGLLLCAAALIWSAPGHYNPEPWHLTDVSGHLPDLRFSLIADNGNPVTEQAYRNHVVLLYFGFTQCESICPVTMARLSGILHKMGKDADNVHVLFVSVDPGHDTPQMLHSYIASFDARHMTGLTGDSGAIEDMAKRYRAAYQPATTSNAIVHSEAVYIFDADGHARLIASDAENEAGIIPDLLRLSHAGQ